MEDGIGMNLMMKLLGRSISFSGGTYENNSATMFRNCLRLQLEMFLMESTGESSEADWILELMSDAFWIASSRKIWVPWE